MATLAEISYCKECSLGQYPAEFGQCKCNGKYRFVLEVELAHAIEIGINGRMEEEDDGIHAGEFVSGDGPVLPAESGVAGDADEPDQIQADEKLPGDGRKGASGDQQTTEECGRSGGDPGDMGGTNKVAQPDRSGDSQKGVRWLRFVSYTCQGRWR